MSKKKPEFEQKIYASTPTSLISTELIKYHKPVRFNRRESKIESEPKNMDFGIISFEEIHKELDAYSISSDEDIVSQFKSIGFTRNEFQIFLGIFDLFLANAKDDYEKPILVSLNDFHEKILGRKNRLRQTDIDKYVNTFHRISSKFIKIDTTTAIKNPYKRKVKGKHVIIDSLIANIAIITLPEYKCTLVKIFPTEYMLYEIRNITYISNHLPRGFIKLNPKNSDNILFFGHFLVKNHNINKKKDLRFKYWECSIKKLISEALSNPDDIHESYRSNNEYKSKYIKRTVLKPLEKALKIMEESNYIRIFEFENLDTKNIFNEKQKLKILFNYSKDSF